MKVFAAYAPVQFIYELFQNSSTFMWVWPLLMCALQSRQYAKKVPFQR